MMFGLIGRKLSHSFSPQIHKELGDYTYKLWEMEEEVLLLRKVEERLQSI